MLDTSVSLLRGSDDSADLAVSRASRLGGCDPRLN